MLLILSEDNPPRIEARLEQRLEQLFATEITNLHNEW
jgi:hypothetical protein